MATKKTSKDQGQPKPETALEKANLSSELVAGLQETAGEGFENQTREDITIPVLHLLQALSPQVKAGMEGAEPGKLFNSVTEELFDSVLLVPAATQHEYVEFVPRAAGGGFVATHALNSDVVKWAKANGEFGAYKVPKGEGKLANELVEFFSIFGVLCDEQDPLGMIVLRFKGTKIGVYKTFNTRMQTCQVIGEGGRKFTPAIFSHLIRVSTAEENRAKGDYWNFVFKSAVENNMLKSLLAADDPRSQMARECRRLVMEDKVKAGYDDGTPSREPGEDDEVGF